jgi:hypothetical protein
MNEHNRKTFDKQFYEYLETWEEHLRNAQGRVERETNPYSELSISFGSDTWEDKLTDNKMNKKLLLL